MRNWLLSIIFIFSVLFSADVNLSIDNFVDDGAGNVTFDIMMSNTEPVFGFQFDFLSGNGVYDGGDNCRCDQGDDALPAGCDECYYDYGVDKVRNNREADTSTSDYLYGCEDSGVCTDGITSSDDCEDEGVCSDGQGATNESDCLVGGSCSNNIDEYVCDCQYADGTWTSDNNYWIPSNSYIPFYNTEDCFDNVNDNGDQLRWDYYNPDGNNDNFAAIADQRCHVPEYDSEYHEDDSIAGHCSQFEAICRGTGEAGTTPGEILPYTGSCCNSTFGGLWVYPFRDKTLCDEFDFDWVSYEDEATCESYGGFWYGSEEGTEGNETYDVGEYFIDADASLTIASGSGGSSSTAGFFISASGSTVLALNFTSTTIPASEVPVSLVTLTANYSGLSVGDVFELLSMSVCGTGSLGDWSGTNCPNDLIFSDPVANELETEFSPSLWTVGSGISSIASDDGICSAIGGWGEDSESDSTCEAYCGDGYCTNGEEFSTCSVDCESYCGDGVCSLYEGNDDGDAETAESESCPSDCVIFGCGDFICSEGETSTSCPYDCYNAYCGDGSCDIDGSENAFNCYEDCQPICGNNVCDDGEDFSNCSDDCPSTCGDGIYDHAGVDLDGDGFFGTEDESCTEDYIETCGDGFYHHSGLDDAGTEDESCTEDYIETCGDGFYHHSGLDDAGSEDETCEADYEVSPGDGYCDPGENPSNDGNDCTSECGDGFYDHAGIGGSENENCQDYVVTCNDGICDDIEDYESCLGDCPLPVCGDGNCETPVEDFTNCSDDCVSFCGDGIYDHSGIDFDDDGIFGVEDESCVEDYGVTCGDGYYDWANGEVADGNDEGTEPDCDDYEPTCGDGYYDYGANEVTSCYAPEAENVDFVDYITNCSSYDFCDYVLTCGDGFCDPVNAEQNETGETYCEADCVIDLVDGCTDLSACNYNDEATNDDGSCIPIEDEKCDCFGNVDYGCGCGEPAAMDGFDCEGEPLSTGINMPITFSLSANYPNPFNPVTSIEYSVEKAGQVNIAIYNVMGHKVFDLVSGYHSPGIRYSAVWNSNAQSNIPVSTGIYFYEMRSGDYIERKKMVLVK